MKTRHDGEEESSEGGDEEVTSEEAFGKEAAGRDFRLTDVHGNVVTKLLA